MTWCASDFPSTIHEQILHQSANKQAWLPLSAWCFAIGGQSFQHAELPAALPSSETVHGPRLYPLSLEYRWAVHFRVSVFCML